MTVLSSQKRGILSENGYCREVKLFFVQLIAVMWVFMDKDQSILVAHCFCLNFWFRSNRVYPPPKGAWGGLVFSKIFYCKVWWAQEQSYCTRFRFC